MSYSNLRWNVVMFFSVSFFFEVIAPFSPYYLPIYIYLSNFWRKGTKNVKPFLNFINIISFALTHPMVYLRAMTNNQFTFVLLNIMTFLLLRLLYIPYTLQTFGLLTNPILAVYAALLLLLPYVLCNHSLMRWLNDLGVDYDTLKGIGFCILLLFWLCVFVFLLEIL